MKQQNSRAGVVRFAFKASTLFCTAFARVALAWASALAYGSPTAIERVETTNAILSLKAGSGDLIGLRWKRPQLELIGEAKLGENFRILLPKPDYEANYFNSRDQVLRKIEKLPDRVVLHYGPLKNEREEVNVNVDYEIRDTGTQLNFSIQVDNPTDRLLAEVFYAIIGGQQGIEQRLDTESLVPGGYDNLAPKLFSQFKAAGLNIGGRFDFNGFGYPGAMPMGWMDIYNAKAGIGYYYANQDPETRVTTLYTEVRPYTKTMVMSPKDNWPNPAELPPGEPVGLTLGWVNFPYASKGIFRAGPIALQVHEGDWHTGATLYRAWFDQHFQVARPPNWLRKEMAWQAFIILQPKDVIVFRFKDLPRLAADAKRYGVTTMEIEGWNAGGNDRGYPNFRLDPRLGTVEEFRKALADMRAIGVHTILMSEDVLADTSTEAFKTRYSRYAVQGRWAPDWLTTGAGEGTIGSRVMAYTGTSTRLRRNSALISPSHPDFREELIRQYLQLIQDGAEGLQLDVNPFGLLDFNPNVPTSPDKLLPEGILKTFQEYKTRARNINPNVALAGNDDFDRAFPYLDVWRNMLPGRDPSSVALRYTFPEWTAGVLAITPGDLDEMSNGLRYGMVWLVTERLYGSLDEPLNRPLSRHVSELIRIRKQYADLLFFGRFNDTEGAQVVGDKENIRYSVFMPMDANSSQRACVVVNFGDGDEKAEVSLPGKDGQKVTISAPFEPDRLAVLPVKLTLPAHRAAVVVAEQ